MFIIYFEKIQSCYPLICLLLPLPSRLPASFHFLVLFYKLCVSQWVSLGLFVEAWAPYQWQHCWRTCLSNLHQSLALYKYSGVIGSPLPPHPSVSYRWPQLLWVHNYNSHVMPPCWIGVQLKSPAPFSSSYILSTPSLFSETVRGWHRCPICE